MYLGEYRIDDYVDLVATTHRFSSGAAYAATSITYRVYEDGSDVQIIADTAMTAFDTITGLYLNHIQLTAALGFETGKTYAALIQATVDGVAAIDWRSWKVVNARDANVVSQANIDFGALQKTSLNAATPASVQNIPATGIGFTALPWNAAWDAEVESECNDALNTAIAEMAQGIPPVTPTPKQALMYLYMAWRNEVKRTAGLYTVSNDAGIVICKASLSDDGTTFTKVEFISGA